MVSHKYSTTKDISTYGYSRKIVSVKGIFSQKKNIISNKFELIFLVFFVLRNFTFYAIWKMDCFSKKSLRLAFIKL